MLLPLFLLPSIFLVQGAVINVPDDVKRDVHELDARTWLTYDQWNAMNIQNNYRRGRNLRPLVWDTVLQRDAQNWAYHLAFIDQMVHSQNRGSEGENLAWISGGSNPLSISAQMWMDEDKDYWGQIIPNGNFEAYGHYSKTSVPIMIRYGKR
ncbi:hypothetical protein TruAng_008911 [Truncatella angustata]|nr:hypothetical protein TruAng_008911 [Truncatella angustata]